MTSGYSAPTSVTTRRHRREQARTLALSTEVTCFLRRRASLKATWATRRTSSAVWRQVSSASSAFSQRGSPK